MSAAVPNIRGGKAVTMTVSPSPRPRVPVSPRPRVTPSPCLRVPASPRPRVSASPDFVSAPPRPEYLWYEAENMRGFGTKPNGEPIQNPSWMNLPQAKAPGWGMNGPGVSAEWSQGGESEWNSAAASADETRAQIYQDLEIMVRLEPLGLELKVLQFKVKENIDTMKIQDQVHMINLTQLQNPNHKLKRLEILKE